MIMHLVLVPGEVHIRASKEQGVKAKIQHVWDAVQRIPKGNPKIPTLPSLPGFQMLATCKIAYGQNHEMFYRSNTFFLPPGGFDETRKHFFNNLQAVHVNMINRLGITLGLQDLTPVVFKQVQDVMLHNHRYLDPDHVGPAWGITVEVVLLDIWEQKLKFLRGTRGLKSVKLATDDEVLEIDGSKLWKALKGIGERSGDFRNCAKEVASLVGRAKSDVRNEIARRVNRDGWRALRAWVNGGGFRSRLY